jgi:hypothetical protein
LFWKKILAYYVQRDYCRCMYIHAEM